ncbi:hypothetical protein [Endozoicomonas elysicola]|uniref:Spore coat protein U domain-containing protein n=1 Tax=Endozoicomonas elysicola TaxID=305900 RepID=A0A081KD02_9GAMM|nr:hypothetical protein [Endozoicomonas elysicola]KEI72028.1 hypothetical protein GV64_16020 [Endozoicomonas elysicola]
MNQSSYVLLWCFWLCVVWSDTSQAGFEFISYDAPAMDLSTATRKNISYQFSVVFSSQCSQGCTGPQHYRLAFSATSIGSGSGSAPPISEGQLGKLIKGKVRFATTGDDTPAGKKKFSPGQWSGDITGHQNTTVTATFTVRFSTSQLQSIVNSGQNSLLFYVVGEDTESARYYDTLAIKIPLHTREEVQITGLSEIVLNAGIPSGTYLESSISACVYSSSGNISVDLDGANAPGKPFQLSQTDQCDAMNACIPYVVRIQNTGQSNWLEYQKKGDQKGVLNASRDQGCQQRDNLTIQVRINSQSLYQTSAGQFKDTLTITVTPM